MFSAFHLFLASLQLILAVVIGRDVLRSTGPQRRYGLLLVPVTIGLVYDNLIIGLGSTIGEGPLLRDLSALRFILHALCTPLLVIYGFGLLRALGVGWAQRRGWHAAFCGLAVALIALGAYSDIVRLDLVVRTEMDAVKYSNVGGLKGPPIPAIVAIAVMIGAGVVALRKARSPYVLAGSAFMFVAAMAGLRVPGLANLGEVAMAGALAAGERVKSGGAVRAAAPALGAVGD
jgi:hypothetical protein